MFSHLSAPTGMMIVIAALLFASAYNRGIAEQYDYIILLLLGAISATKSL